MRIFIDARFWGLENAGLGRYTINFIEELKKVDRENEYVILLRKRYFDELKFPSNWKKVLGDFGHYSISEQITLPKIIAQNCPDIVHFLHFNVPVFYRGPFIVTIHDMLMHKSSGRETTTLPFYSYVIKRIVYKFVFRQAVIKSKIIIVPTKYVKDDVVDYFGIDPKKVEVVYEGVSKAENNSSDDGAVLKKYGVEKPYFIYTGNAYPHKNLKRAIEAVAEVNLKTKKNVNLVLVTARNVFAKRLSEIIRILDADRCVKILGFVPDEELFALYKNSVAFVYPSLFEGFGLPGLEAMGAGTVVLASDITVFREVYRDVPMYFDPHDYSSIQKAMQDVMDVSSVKRAEKIQKGRDLAKTYSWEKMAREILKVYLVLPVLIDSRMARSPTRS